MTKLWGTLALAVTVSGCFSDREGIARAPAAETTVKYDFFHKPLPEIPVPNDLATRPDDSSPTGLRVNASMVAPTQMEVRARELIDQLDGWGVFQPIAIPFTGPLDIQSILDGHRDADYDTKNDVIYLIDIDRDSPDFGQLQYLDVGNGNYPPLLENRSRYGPHDARGDSLSLFFEEVHEDLDGDGELDEGEDTDADGLLDVPNYLPGICDKPGDASCPDPADLGARADALMTFYERQTDTLIVRPMVPLRERTTYAVVITRRLLDANGEPVGSPFPWIHHLGQTEALRDLEEVLPHGSTLDDVAFAYTFTTQSVESDWVAVREGLYGYGPQAHLGEDFPPRVHELFKARDGGPGVKNQYIAYAEQLRDTLELIATQVVSTGGERMTQLLRESNRYIDFNALGSFESPQLLMRVDENKKPLPFNLQSWPNDLYSAPAAAGREAITFWLAVPRREVSVRGNDPPEPVPVVVWSHAYGSTKLEALAFAGLMARHGFATVAIDAPSHGVAIPPDFEPILDTVLAASGVGPALKASLQDRATDQTGDGLKDPGADMVSAYSFHSRDMYRQNLLDHMQLIRVLRSFDGKRSWAFDVDDDGVNDLAGDFDGDGHVDVGMKSTFYSAGISMGGMTSTALASIEPHIRFAGPIVGGGGMADIGGRSQNVGVPEAIYLRLMGPSFIVQPGTSGEPPVEDGSTAVYTLLPNGNDPGLVELTRIDPLSPGDTLRVVNRKNGSAGCGVVAEDGTVRAAVEADEGDKLRLEFYAKSAIVLGSTTCEVKKGAKELFTIDSFDHDTDWKDLTYPEGSALVALGDGLGYRRAHPDLRRSAILGQAVVDRTDPAVLARHLMREPLEYPNLDEKTGARAMMVLNTGDMSVPTSTGMAMARAAGLLDFLEEDPRYGMPPNQVLIDNYVAEAVNTYGRFTCDADACDGLPEVTPGSGIHIDTDNLSEGTDVWGDAVPRLEPPLRLWNDGSAEKKHIPDGSGLMFLYTSPAGNHEPPFPGQHVDLAEEYCNANLPDEDCAAYAEAGFDTGTFLVNMLMHAAAAGLIETDRCLAHSDCDFTPPPPPNAPATPTANRSSRTF